MLAIARAIGRPTRLQVVRLPCRGFPHRFGGWLRIERQVYKAGRGCWVTPFRYSLGSKPLLGRVSGLGNAIFVFPSMTTSSFFTFEVDKFEFCSILILDAELMDSLSLAFLLVVLSPVGSAFSFGVSNTNREPSDTVWRDVGAMRSTSIFLLTKS